MVWKDFFGVKWDEYAQRISTYTVERLRKQEIVKIRQIVAAGLTITGGVVNAAFTCGGTLALSAYGARRARVALKKLELIRNELTKRNIELHKLALLDIMIPFIAYLTGLGIGIGLEEIAMVATNTIPMQLASPIPTGTTALKEIATNPSVTAHGLGSGIAEQVKEMVATVPPIAHGVIPGSEMSHQMLVANTTWVPSPSEAQVISFHDGMVLAQAGEKTLATFIGTHFTQGVMEAMTGMKAAKLKLACRKLLDELPNPKGTEKSPRCTEKSWT